MQKRSDRTARTAPDGADEAGKPPGPGKTVQEGRSRKDGPDQNADMETK
ncbi:hypothetical protein CBFG_02149 [Clostridiales bacterium 1_7_47FAA]|nr:hypothetical protein CBFG_02149 [Clostridiales bacterium 1_7_47FAA]